VHLGAERDGADVQVAWIRRTADRRGQYVVRVMDGGNAALREERVSSSSWHYDASQRVKDLPGPGAESMLAQVSDRFGPGPFARIALQA